MHPLNQFKSILLYYNTLLELDDISLATLAKYNKDKAFILLIHAYSKKVFNTCINLLRNKEDAEDVTQEFYHRLFWFL